MAKKMYIMINDFWKDDLDGEEFIEGITDSPKKFAETNHNIVTNEIMPLENYRVESVKTYLFNKGGKQCL